MDKHFSPYKRNFIVEKCNTKDLHKIKSVRHCVRIHVNSIKKVLLQKNHFFGSAIEDDSTKNTLDSQPNPFNYSSLTEWKRGEPFVRYKDTYVRGGAFC